MSREGESPYYSPLGFWQGKRPRIIPVGYAGYVPGMQEMFGTPWKETFANLSSKSFKLQKPSESRPVTSRVATSAGVVLEQRERENIKIQPTVGKPPVISKTGAEELGLPADLPFKLDIPRLKSLLVASQQKADPPHAPAPRPALPRRNPRHHNGQAGRRNPAAAAADAEPALHRGSHVRLQPLPPRKLRLPAAAAAASHRPPTVGEGPLSARAPRLPSAWPDAAAAAAGGAATERGASRRAGGPESLRIEFLAGQLREMCYRKVKGHGNDISVREIFRRFDSDKDGDGLAGIDCDEFCTAVRRMMLGNARDGLITDAEARRLFRRLDRNGNGSIDYRELAAELSAPPAAADSEWRVLPTSR